MVQLNIRIYLKLKTMRGIKTILFQVRENLIGRATKKMKDMKYLNW